MQPQHGANTPHGWLVFETKGEKRRLVGFPSDWADEEPENLERLCKRAVEAPRPRRLIE